MHVNWKSLQQVNNFSYLGQLITDGNSYTEGNRCKDRNGHTECNECKDGNGKRW